MAFLKSVKALLLFNFFFNRFNAPINCSMERKCSGREHLNCERLFAGILREDTAEIRNMLRNVRLLLQNLINLSEMHFKPTARFRLQHASHEWPIDRRCSAYLPLSILLVLKADFFLKKKKDNAFGCQRFVGKNWLRL